MPCPTPTHQRAQSPGNDACTHVQISSSQCLRKALRTLSPWRWERPALTFSPLAPYRYRGPHPWQQCMRHCWYVQTSGKSDILGCHGSAQCATRSCGAQGRCLNLIRSGYTPNRGTVLTSTYDLKPVCEAQPLYQPLNCKRSTLNHSFFFSSADLLRAVVVSGWHWRQHLCV